jgi:hypothetical protein
MHKTLKAIYEEIVRERPPCERNEVLRDHICQGRSTMEHAWIHRGRQIPDKWAIVRLCEWGPPWQGIKQAYQRMAGAFTRHARGSGKIPGERLEANKKILKNTIKKWQRDL